MEVWELNLYFYPSAGGLKKKRKKKKKLQVPTAIAWLPAALRVEHSLVQYYSRPLLLVLNYTQHLRLCGRTKAGREGASKIDKFVVVCEMDDGKYVPRSRVPGAYV